MTREDAVKELTRPASYRPEGYISIDRHMAAMQLCFDGLLLHYAHAVSEGRQQAWKEAGTAIINLFSELPYDVKRAKRSDLPK